MIGDYRRSVAGGCVQADGSSNWQRHDRGQCKVGRIARHHVQQLATSPRAGQHHLVDFALSDLCQLPDIAAGLRDVVRRYRLCRITCKLMEAVKYRTQLGHRVEGAMGSLRNLEGLRISEQPLDEPIQLLSANPSDIGEAVSGFRDLDAGPIETACSFPDCRATSGTAPVATGKSAPLGWLLVRVLRSAGRRSRLEDFKRGRGPLAIMRAAPDRAGRP